MRKRAVRRARIFLGEELAGFLERTDRGATFLYDAAYLDRHRSDRGPLAGAIALHLPLQTKAHVVTGINVHPFFAGLLPEGARLEALLRGVKTSPDDLLSLLAVVGDDCVGDVAVVSGDHPSDHATPMLEPERVGDSSFRELLKRSLEYGNGGDRITTSGAQDKISAAMISLPVKARVEAYLLKLEPKGFPRIVENEAFMMSLARQAGLPTADTRIVHDREGVSGLLVRRFDRVAGGVTEPLRKLHVEDGCQLADRYPADKYVISMGDMARAITQHSSTPILDVAMLIRVVAFSYAIANGDLHAKNISLLLSPDRATLTMSPVYDLLTTLPYRDTHMALMLDGRDKNLRRNHFVAFGERFGVRAPATQLILDEVCQAVGASIDRVGEIGFPARQTAHLERTMRRRCLELG